MCNYFYTYLSTVIFSVVKLIWIYWRKFRDYCSQFYNMGKDSEESGTSGMETQGDADAAAEAGIPFIFAEYGFGSVKDAAARIASPSELPSAVERIFAEQ